MPTITQSDLDSWVAMLNQEQADLATVVAKIKAGSLPNAGTPVPPAPGTGPVTNPISGFAGLDLGDPAVWGQSPLFKDDFPSLAAPGQFPQTYKYWSVYPKGWVDTSKKGTYDPANISVIDRIDGIRALRQIVRSGASGVFGGCVAMPEWGSSGAGYASSYRFSVRRQLVQQDKGHDVLLGWPANDDDWPTKSGEPDHIENDTSGNPNIEGFLHVKGAKSGSDHQVWLPSGVKAYDKMHVITIEHIAGKSYRRYIDGVLKNVILTAGQSATAADKASQNLTILDSGYSVPDMALRTCLQLESNGSSPADKVVVDTDWLVVQGLK